MEKITTLSLMERIPDEASAWAFMEELRWKGTPVCPHCGNDGRCYFLTPRDGNRTTSTGRATYRRLWKCAACRRPFSVLTGTVMHGSKVPLRTWIMVIFEMASNKNGVAAYEVSRRYGLTNKSAWFLLHRIREAMADHGLDVFRGTVIADETWVGGDPRNRHKGKQRLGDKAHVKSNTEKAVVFSLIDKATGRVRSRVVADVRGHTLRKVIAEQVDMAGSVLHTDAAKHYLNVGSEFIDHQSVNHAWGEYVRYDNGTVITTNDLEGFFSQLKRSLDGTHHHVSKVHLHRYLGEFDFRYSTRKQTDTERMSSVIAQAAGRRLTYRPLVERG